VAGVCGQADQHCCAPSIGGGGGGGGSGDHGGSGGGGGHGAGACVAAGGACMRMCQHGGSELPDFSGGCGVGSHCCHLILP